MDAAALDDSTDFARNLALLCSYEQSIAEVCRRIGINRPQFNRYLASTARPSRRNLRRICDHFGVADWEVLLPHERFAEIASLKPHRRGLVRDEWATLYPVRVYENAKRLPERYLGYYFRYFRSNAFPGAITRSLVRVFDQDNRVVWKNIELLRHAAQPGEETYTAKFIGEVLYLSERIHIFEHEAILGNSLCYTMLYPNYRNHVTWLTGMQASVSGVSGRPPVAATIVLEYLGRKIDVRKAMASCGAFPEDSEDINWTAVERLRLGSRQLAQAFTVQEP